MKSILLLLLVLVTQPAFASWDYDRGVTSFQGALQSHDPNKVALKANDALQGLVLAATNKLHAKGYSSDAEAILEHWQTLNHKLIDIVKLEKLGDYAPLSQFLTDLYNTLEADLGKDLCKLLHFDDIYIFNYSIPVVFHLSTITQPISATEYDLHFDPFAGVVAYWTVFLTCEVATYSTGWFLICTPAGMAAEYVTLNYIAPQFSTAFWVLEYPM